MVVARADGFLNVDLEIGARTRAQLAPLLEAVDGRLFELFRGRLGRLYRAHFEPTGCAADASTAIHELADAIERLGARARRAWASAAMRDFNIGLELEPGVRNIELAIDPEAVRRVADLEGRIAVTAYQVAAMRRATRRPAKRRPRR